MRRVYLDHAATTPVRREVADLMMEYLVNKFGNASSIHSWGREARQAVDEAREQVARLIGADPAEVIFTSGGTESDNLAIRGTMAGNAKKGKHLVTTQIEHHAILHTTEHEQKDELEVTYLPVDQDGFVSLSELDKAIRPDTVMVSVMLANNEVGTIQDIRAISAICKKHSVLLHTDAVQALGQVPIKVHEMGIDLMSISSHKVYGPKGAGAVYVRKGVRMLPVQFGGSHERGKRAGTENVPGIVGFGKAAELAMAEFDDRVKHYTMLRDRLIDGLLKIHDTRLNGPREHRLPNNVNVSVLYVEGEALLLTLDMNGIGASSGSACTSGSLDPSHVLMAMGMKHEQAHSSLRLTVGTDNTVEDIDYVLSVMPGIVERLRAMSALSK
jgi:cysteine desulfurase